MTNINHIQVYQRSHNGDLPPLSCCLNCFLVMKFYQHPYQYDYYGGKASDVDLIIKTILNLNANRLSSVYHKNSNNPHILKLIRQGSSHSMIRPNSTNNNNNKSHLQVNNNTTLFSGQECSTSSTGAGAGGGYGGYVGYTTNTTINNGVYSPKRMLSNNNKIFPMEYTYNTKKTVSYNNNNYFNYPSNNSPNENKCRTSSGGNSAGVNTANGSGNNRECGGVSGGVSGGGSSNHSNSNGLGGNIAPIKYGSVNRSLSGDLPSCQCKNDDSINNNYLTSPNCLS